MNPSTSDDPVMADLMAKKSGTVYATDNMVSAVMCAARSVYGWDLIVTKKDGALVIDKRSEGNFDLLTVSETAQAMIEDDKDNINGVHKLSEESTVATLTTPSRCSPKITKSLEPTPIPSARTTRAPLRLATATVSGTDRKSVV